MICQEETAAGCGDPLDASCPIPQPECKKDPDQDLRNEPHPVPPDWRTVTRRRRRRGHFAADCGYCRANSSRVTGNTRLMPASANFFGIEKLFLNSSSVTLSFLSLSSSSKKRSASLLSPLAGAVDPAGAAGAGEGFDAVVSLAAAWGGY